MDIDLESSDDYKIDCELQEKATGTQLSKKVKKGIQTEI